MLFKSVSANQVFFLNDRSAAVRDYRATVGRLNALALAVSNAGAPPRNHPHHERLSEIREFIRDNGRRFSPRSPSAADLEKINAIRTAFAEYSELAGQDLLERIFNDAETQSRTSLMVDAPTPDQDSDFSQQIPQYCQNYPILDRDLLESFYQGSREGEDFNCYELGGNGVGLDLSEIGPALVSLERRSYERQTQQLQRALMMKAISGILEESSAYAGVYPGTDNNLGNLNRCSYNRSQELRNMVAEHRGGLPQTVERLNSSFGPGENARRNALMAEQVRQALIIGNLYNITDRARAQSDGSQLAVVGGSPLENVPQEVVIPCREQMERDYGFAYQGVITDYTYLPRRCAELLDQERFANMPECIEAYRAFEENLTLQTQQQACYYQQSGRSEEAPRVISADNLIPLMSASVDSYPLLFNREDSRSLIPFVSSDSNYIPSQFAENVKELAGAAQISRAVEDLLATNPENPRQAIDELLAEEEMVNLMSQVITSAQQSEPMNNSLKDEITRYQNELGESAANVCRNEGEHLHQFPSLVNDVIADELSEVDDPRERERLLARRQAAQCWLLESDPPESEGGLPSGFFALGVGAIALGMVPVVGWAASAALVATGTGVAATDSYLRFDHARDQLQATTAAFQGGWADSNLVLLRSENALSAETNLWLEGLTVGILDVATPAVRAGLRTFRTPQGIRESINRQVRGETSASETPLVRDNSTLGGASGANIPNVPLDGRFLRYEEAAINFSAVPNQYRVRVEEIHEDLFENSLEPFRFNGPNGAIDNVYVDSNRYGHFLDHVHALNSPEEVSDLLTQINQLSPEQLRNRLNRWRISRNEPPLDADTHSSVVLSELSKFLGDTAGLRPNNKKVTTLFRSDWPPARVLEEVRQNPSIVQTVENTARTDGQVQVKFTIDNVQYTAWICRRAPQCDGDLPVNRMESLFPTCGDGVVQLNSRARFARHIQDNHGSTDSFTPPGFNHIGAAVTFGDTGSTKPWDGGLIREVRCRP